MDLLEEAEHVLEMSVSQEVLQGYQTEKIKLMYGPFSEIVTRLQKQNITIEKELSKMAAMNNMSLHDYAMHKIKDMSKQCDSFICEPESVEEACTQLQESLNKIEKDMKEEMQQIKAEIVTNNVNYTKLKQQMKNITFTPREPTKSDEKSQKLYELQNKIARGKAELNSVEKRNKELLSSTKLLQNEIKQKESSYNIIIQKAKEKENRQKSTKSMISDLQKEYNETDKQIELIKINQRYSSTKVRQAKQSDLDDLIAVRKEVENLNLENVDLHNQKKSLQIKAIRNTQRGLSSLYTPSRFL